MQKNEKKKLLFVAVGTALLLIVALTLILSSKNFGGNGDENSVRSEQEKNPLSKGKGYFRVLVAGSDRTSGLSDVLMLVSVNRDTKEAWILQLPRDTYAGFTEESYRKLNGAVSALGGMAKLKDFLSRALGISIDRYVRLSPDVFCRAVDAVGGVEIELSEPMNYEDPAQGLSIHLPKGKQILDGERAEQFVRYRSGYARGDLDRMDAQKLFLSLLFEKISGNLSPVTAGKLAAAFLEDIESDLRISDTVMLVGELFSLEAERIFFVTAPGEDAIAARSGASYYVLSSSGMEALLSEHFGAEKGDFDPDSVFLNSDYEEFRSIYGGYRPYVAFFASRTKDK